MEHRAIMSSTDFAGHGTDREATFRAVTEDFNPMWEAHFWLVSTSPRDPALMRAHPAGHILTCRSSMRARGSHL
jgi:hypothetical protein